MKGDDIISGGIDIYYQSTLEVTVRKSIRRHNRIKKILKILEVF